ncbi:unnamed protein product [Vitrella brassicaformis CCMP3155]|uniref:TrmE-type G domain-containing protein n=1 Tax=Vitrella brassicaformis (strain CCMP3155) TaxID=1169540 RepID=A0A0G4EE61_VITBC|nr:unnamed protein product [Vitrella brassicaformis CCMP3155]|eukprot:CEL94029.1 unnamed protein product [Vitrella brassicaformis CCMP3155]
MLFTSTTLVALVCLLSEAVTAGGGRRHQGSSLSSFVHPLIAMSRKRRRLSSDALHRVQQGHASSSLEESSIGQDAADDTIYALSSGSGKAGVAVIRISGPLSPLILQLLTTDPSTRPCSSSSSNAIPYHGLRPLPPPRQAVLRRIYDPLVGELLDQGLVMWFPSPHSFTGDDTVELHLHGSRAVIEGVFEAFRRLQNALVEGWGEVRVRFDGLRPAERGEYTRRAFENGRLDLMEVEGLADLIAADTSSQRQQAIRQMRGGLSAVYERWRHELTSALAWLEAAIDFGDDDVQNDVEEQRTMQRVRERVDALVESMERALKDNRRGEIVRSGVRVGLFGPPNAGKSSLLNALARRPAAIVSSTPGTTRDLIEVPIDLSGVPVIVTDTAGIREGGPVNDHGDGDERAAVDPVEVEGMRRSWKALKGCQIGVLVLDLSVRASGAPGDDHHGGSVKWLIEPLRDMQMDGEGPSFLLVVLNKADLQQPTGGLLARVTTAIRETMGGKWADERCETIAASCPVIDIGANLGDVHMGQLDGIDGVERALGEVVQKAVYGDPGRAGGGGLGDVDVIITRERHRVHLQSCVEALRRFKDDPSMPLDLACEELRVAVRSLGRVVGAVDVEEILDVIFRDFCIGK